MDHPLFGEKRRLADVTALLLNQLVAHLRRVEGRNGPLADSTVETILKPMRSCLRQARDEGLIAHNPAQGLRVPKTTKIDDHDEEEVRALTAAQLSILLELVPSRHRLMFRFLAATGLRVSELFAVQWRHLELESGSPHVRIRRAIVRGKLEPPKTRHGRRDVPLPRGLVEELRAWRKASEWPRDEDLVFPSLAGTPQNYGALRHRVLVPTAREAGVPWISFHTFRHTVASMLFEQGHNAKQVQRWLGHHTASFTLDTYIHLLSDELDEPLELPRGGNEGATSARLGGADHDRRDPSEASV